MLPVIPIANCPFCGVVYRDTDRTVIASGPHDETLHVTCAACRNALAMSVVRTPGRVRSVGVLTDCNAKDYATFHKGKRVSIDDVLAVHDRLHR